MSDDALLAALDSIPANYYLYVQYKHPTTMGTAMDEGTLKKVDRAKREIVLFSPIYSNERSLKFDAVEGIAITPSESSPLRRKAVYEK